MALYISSYEQIYVKYGHNKNYLHKTTELYNINILQSSMIQYHIIQYDIKYHIIQYDIKDHLNTLYL